MKNTLNESSTLMDELVRWILYTKIVNRQLRPGQKLLSEEELSLEFKVSKAVIGTVLSELEQEALIQRHDTEHVVSEEISEHHRTKYESIEQVIKGTGTITGLEIENTKISRLVFPLELSEFFDVPMEKEICFLRGIRTLDDIPIQLVETYFLKEGVLYLCMKDASDKDMTQTIKEICNFNCEDSKIYLKYIPADSVISKMLNCPVLSPLVILSASYYLKSGKPLVYSRYFMLAEHFNMEMEIN